MKTCRVCKIYWICVFNDTIREAMGKNEDRYMDDPTQTMCDIEEVLARHCVYYTEISEAQAVKQVSP